MILESDYYACVIGEFIAIIQQRLPFRIRSSKFLGRIFEIFALYLRFSTLCVSSTFVYQNINEAYKFHELRVLGCHGAITGMEMLVDRSTFFTFFKASGKVSDGLSDVCTRASRV